MPPVRLSGRLSTLAAAVLLVLTPVVSPAQETRVSGQMLDRGRQILEQVRKDLERYYYDTTYGGVDMQAAYEKARTDLETARDNNHLFTIIAQYLFGLQDSHTKFWPPDRAARIEYGFAASFIGDTCFITGVTKGSDAEAQGIRRGDALLAVDRFKIERASWNTFTYLYYQLSPRSGLQLLVKSPGGEPRRVAVTAKITRLPPVIDFSDPSAISRFLDELDRYDRTPQHTYVSLGDSVLIWRMPSFSVPKDGVEEMMKIARGHRSIVLDLRNNGGGLLETQMSLVGHFFDRPVWAGMEKRRGKTDSLIVKPSGKEPFRGRLVVLVNGNSASASEITARVLQHEGRAIVVGDRTAGAVVASYVLGREVGFGRVMHFAVQISVWDIEMADGRRLENIGVIPDHVVLPTGEDLAAWRDPQLAFALQLVGHQTTPDEAAVLFRSDREARERSR